MTDPSDNRYLRDAVMTASPEQLHLMLYDGAIRFSTQARDAIENGDIEKSYNLLSRTQRIIAEMEKGLRHEVQPELCRRMAALYHFVFTKLVDANVHKDLKALDDALKVLRYQRETWVLLVKKLQQERAEHEHCGRVSQDSLSIEG